jgi:SOS response regulatory protein OraA/RecX
MENGNRKYRSGGSRRMRSELFSEEDENLCEKTAQDGAEAEDGKGKEEKSEYDRALETALRIIMFGENSVRMMREKLIKRGYSTETSAVIIEKLCEKNLLCDSRLIEKTVASLAEKKFYGKGRIRIELLRKFDRESIEIYFEDAAAEIDFVSAAERFALKNYRSGRERLINAMRKRGYDSSEIKAALVAVKNAQSSIIGASEAELKNANVGKMPKYGRIAKNTVNYERRRRQWDKTDLSDDE